MFEKIQKALEKYAQKVAVVLHMLEVLLPLLKEDGPAPKQVTSLQAHLLAAYRQAEKDLTPE